MKKLRLITLFLTINSFANETIKFSGMAYKSSKKKELIYKEVHTVTYSEDQIQTSLTNYFDKEDKKIAYLDCNYKKSPFTPECKFEDARTGQVEVTTVESGKIKIDYKENSKAKSEVSKLKLNKKSSASQGLLQFIVNLNKKNKKSAVTDFIFPSRGTDIALKIKRKTKGDKTTVDIDVDNFLLKMFTSKITMTFNQKNQLIDYYGNSNISTKAGERQNVYIEYFY